VTVNGNMIEGISGIINFLNATFTIIYDAWSFLVYKNPILQHKYTNKNMKKKKLNSKTKIDDFC
jgi:hypothetical protein